ncbi:hypothetical protein [Saccharopolyspora phatthalungensis]|uniref:Virulence-associated protein VagC n=1 Tax=Saccharopolyspora phatthalungensis TaxID=664693 RepID=A0A840Q351_9PSEU|nr:hypothetical protein [Saccharopolyspora phatthalungensis]MBB5154417.1 virulence-associated protein VagC [Saccharopolyspora phatthalungensis]
MNNTSDYRSYGWWVEPDPKTDNTTLIVGGRVSALRMPAEIAARVHQVLSIHLQTGPVLDAGDHWVLFTQSDGRRDRPDDLAEVAVVPAGSRLVLPPLDDPRWINPPRADRSVPERQVIFSATRRARTDTMPLVAA